MNDRRCVSGRHNLCSWLEASCEAGGQTACEETGRQCVSWIDRERASRVTACEMAAGRAWCECAIGRMRLN